MAEQKKNPITEIANRLIDQFDFIDDTYEGFCQSFLKEIEKLEADAKAHPEEIDLKKLPGTVCRHYNVLQQVCELGFDCTDLDCYCYIPWELKGEEKVKE